MEKFSRYTPLAVTVVVVSIALYGLAVWEPSLRQSLPSSTLPAAVTTPLHATTEPTLFEYIEVVDGCGPHYEGTCVNMRSGPGTEFPVVAPLRTGMVLKVVSSIIAKDERIWYKIGFDGYIRYPERMSGDWYVAADYVHSFQDIGDLKTIDGINASSTKRIIIDRSENMLYAYEGDMLFMQQPISVGLEFTPTPRGTFWVYEKMPDSYMQGPLPGISDQYYDLPGVPWDLYFTYQGGAIHGAYWHNNFGQPWSHGCVNLPPEQAKILYEWADLGTPVTVRD